MKIGDCCGDNLAIKRLITKDKSLLKIFFIKYHTDYQELILKFIRRLINIFQEIIHIFLTLFCSFRS
ncbi:MAG: hypothetical protein A3J46_06660 [Candidatus Yanofskybacteria bacterium RIFCSPHIGHO2_02_FULL_41_11]|uniref:Uncharacterized protein n=1 Tax=Candidatus Yanofskybacteria bacterium RIFCSPHIGHO2_02_FULL_41_11 TaxID=1802675 RepID=A0A1F8FBY2_9BACT|nr:MAG: hypothetical protein A3J46_06660 [Candidatus Yanofskybacteria bacterium RIFCSPHIGHO2_02_FULL_41_11]